MIDPKLNDIPVDRSRAATETGEPESADAQMERLRRSRAGLSINDTIAGDTNLSVGSRGVDTSGVAAGAGAGAGMAVPTAGRGDGSPAPNIVPGARGSGTTLRGDGSSEQQPTMAVERGAAREREIPGSDAYQATYGEIARRAYECWHERGCPEGSPEVDWERAEREMRQRQRAAAAGAR
jgi:Protein of unknown function (DUF2934)